MAESKQTRGQSGARCLNTRHRTGIRAVKWPQGKEEQSHRARDFLQARLLCPRPRIFLAFAKPPGKGGSGLTPTPLPQRCSLLQLASSFLCSWKGSARAGAARIGATRAGAPRDGGPRPGGPRPGAAGPGAASAGSQGHGGQGHGAPWPGASRAWSQPTWPDAWWDTGSWTA